MIRNTGLLLLWLSLLAALGGCCAACPGRTHDQQKESAKEAHRELRAE